MSLRYVLLGLLAENSSHGYGLRKEVLHRLGHFRNINEGQLYTELAKMEKEGLIDREVEVPERGPARKLLHITPEGRQRFKEWLLSDQYEKEGVLYDFIQGYLFLTKCTFFNHLSPGEVLAKLDEQITIQRKKEKAYEEILVKMEKRQVDPFRIRILAFGLEEVRHRIRWLSDLKDEFCRNVD